MHIADLTQACSQFLNADKYHDYAPNGLQVQGRAQVQRVVTGVTACLDLIEAARELQADAIFVHHGWFWKREDPRIIGVRHKRIQAILAADMSLVAYHLPLDDHPDIGNNALLGQALGFCPQARFGDDQLGWIGAPEQDVSVAALAERVASALNRAPLVLGDAARCVRRVAWCSGAAQDMIEEAAAAGADCFISGEVSERTLHIAKEAGITYLACGHHATERFGIAALGRWMHEQFDLDVHFVDIDNPV